MTQIARLRRADSWSHRDQWLEAHGYEDVSENFPSKSVFEQWLRDVFPGRWEWRPDLLEIILTRIPHQGIPFCTWDSDAAEEWGTDPDLGFVQHQCGPNFDLGIIWFDL